MPRALISERLMQVSRLIRFVHTEYGIRVLLMWKGLSKSEDTMESVHTVFEHVPVMIKRLQSRKLPETIGR